MCGEYYRIVKDKNSVVYMVLRQMCWHNNNNKHIRLAYNANVLGEM